MTVARARGAKGKADRLFAAIIKAHGSCEHCETTVDDGAQMQTAHVYSRGYAHTRTNFDNAFCLCAACHLRFSKQPLEFSAFVRKHRTARQLRQLAAASRDRTAVDWDVRLAELETIWNDLQGGNR